MWVGVLTLHLEAGSENDGGTTSGGGVHWALVEALGLLDGSGHSGHVHNWKNWMQVLKLHLSQVALLASSARLPTGTLKEEAVNVSTGLGELCVLGLVLGVGDLSHEAHIVEWETGGTGSHLHDGGQVRHWVEES